MIVVDTTVWIDHFGNRSTAQVDCLRDLVLDHSTDLIVGDIMLAEVLQGLATERLAEAVEAELRGFRVMSMLDPDLAVVAARNYRTLRRLGFTVRKTIDLFIGTFCIERGHALLHSDRDFDPMERHLGLQVVAGAIRH